MKTTTELSPQARRKRQFLLILPAIILPFTTLLFWTLGGAKGDAPKTETHKGLSMQLPGAVLGSDSAADKMGFYDRARADSAKQQQLRKTDPYADFKSDTAGEFAHDLFSFHQPAFGEAGSPQGDPAVQARQINQRLTQLQAVLNKPEPVKQLTGAYRQSPAIPDSLLRPKASEDPELRQMSGLLEKILDIQHPERVKAAQPATAAAAPVRKFRALPAVIEGTQKIVQGTVICLKLLDSVTIGGQLFQKGQKLYGSGTLSNQRYTLNIQSIHVGKNFYPVDLTVFDEQDGMEGICVPEAVTAGAMRDGAVGGVQSMDVMSFDPSMTAQLATAGINTVKDAFGKKVKRVKGKLKNGHLLLLRDNSEVKARSF
jgi:hypothetical protein